MSHSVPEQCGPTGVEAAGQSSAPDSQRIRIRRIVRWVLPIAIVTAALLVVYRASMHGEDGARASVLTIPQRSLDFGAVWEQPAFKWIVPVENSTDGTVQIEEIRATCDCTAIEPPGGIVLNAGETKEIALTIDTTGRDWFAGQESQQFEVLLSFRLRLGSARIGQSTKLRGLVRRNPISVSPHLVDFEDSLTFGEPFGPQSAILMVDHDDHVSHLSVRCQPAGMGRAVVERLPESGGRGGRGHRYRLLIWPADSLPPGLFAFTVRVSADDNGAEAAPFQEVPVSGRISSGVEPSPRHINFGLRPLGTSVEEFVVLSSPSGRPFTVENVRPSERGLRVNRRAELENSGRDVKVFAIVQDCRVLGQNSATINFTVRQEAGPLVETNVSVQTSYYGVEPEPKTVHAPEASAPTAQGRN